MAILITGKSRCLLCGQVIASSDEVVATPAFLKREHALARFSDAVFHRRCFNESPEHDEAERLLARFKEVMAAAPPKSTLAEYESWLAQAMRDFE